MDFAYGSTGFSPDGGSIAFTVLSYRTVFWLMEPRTE